MTHSLYCNYVGLNKNHKSIENTFSPLSSGGKFEKCSRNDIFAFAFAFLLLKFKELAKKKKKKLLHANR